MANTTHTVVKGDTLWDLANKYNTTVADLVRLNPDIDDPDLIYVGEVLVVSGTPKEVTTNYTYKPVIDRFGLQANTDRTVFAHWSFDKAKKGDVEHYQVRWHYATGDGIAFLGNDSTTKEVHATWTAPANAYKVTCHVKAIAKKKKVSGKETDAFKSAWSTKKEYYFYNNPPTTPPTPSVTIKQYTLTATLDNLDLNDYVIGDDDKYDKKTNIEFQIVKNDSSVFKVDGKNVATVAVTTDSASWTGQVDAGCEYKVRCRAHRTDINEYSDWSSYSNKVSSVPSKPAGITTCKASTDTSVYLEWSEVKTAKKYDIEYTTKKEYFDISSETTTIKDIESTKWTILNLATGTEYFFRVRSVNDSGESDWSDIQSVVIGKKPAAPTTWSSATVVAVGDPVTLYWVHNAEDGSSQTYADLEVYVDGVDQLIPPIKNTTDEDEKDKTSSYTIDTSGYSVGAKIKWRVSTAGVTNEFGEWSTEREIDVYAQPTLDLGLIDSEDEMIDILESFPFYLKGVAGPNTQAPIGYHVTITANETYDTVDQIGNEKTVSAGEQVYSKYFDTSDPLLIEFSAGNLDLENNCSYTVSCVVSMNSGLTTESTLPLTVAWTDIKYEPNAEIGIDEDTLSAYIRPYCEDENFDLIPDVSLAVYRREFDGSFTELAKGVDNLSNTFITDPHPALDYARYRVVATSNITGAVSYYDLPGHPVGEKAAVIQWAEHWSNFETDSDDPLEQPAWAGSMLKLPYNIDVSDSNKPDTELVEYIGRAHPVSYYGTQLGSTSTWNVSVEKSDVETLYALRRLAKWMGDVYVREPSGSGYWANVTVSFSQKHCDLIIPVTLNIVRVEGGI